MLSFLNKRKLPARIFLLAICLSVFSAATFLNHAGVLVPFWQTSPLINIQPEIGYAYTVRTDYVNINSGKGFSLAQVLENGYPLGPTNSLHDDIRNLGGGRTSFWGEYVYFSTSDNSNPNTNSRKYEIHYPLLVNAIVATISYFLTGLLWLIVLTTVVRDRKAQIIPGFYNLRAKLISGLKLMTVPAIVASIVPIYLLFTIPPTFISTDAASYFSWKLSSWIPQYQPGYLIFVRVINNVVSGNWSNLTFSSPVNTQALYTIIVIQHILTVIGIAYFASTVVRSPFAKGFIALLLSLLPVVSFYSHGIFQEALLPALILIMSASILRAYDGDGISIWLAISIGAPLYGMLLIRYDPVPLLLLPSCVFLLVGLFAQNRQPCFFKKAAYLFFTNMTVLVLFYATSLTIELSTGTYDRPFPLGRRGVYLITESPVQHNVQKKQILIDEIEADSADAIEKDSIEPIFNSSPAWVVHYWKVYEIVKAANPNWNSEEISNRTDEILNKTFYLYVKHGTTYYLSDVKKHFLDHLASRPLTNLVWAMDDSIALFDRQQTARPYEVFKDLTIFSDPQTKVLYQRTKMDGIWVDLYAKTPSYGTFFVIGFLLVILNAVFQKTRTHFFLIAIPFLFFGLAHILFVSAVIIALPRYHHIGIVLLTISLIILIVNLFENMSPIIRSLLARQKHS